MPTQEISDQPQPRLLALFGMELGSCDIITPDHRRQRPAVIRPRDEVRRIGKAKMIAVDKIGMHAGGEPDQQRMRRLRLAPLPPHMTDRPYPVIRLRCS